MTNPTATDPTVVRPSLAPPDWAYHGFPLLSGERLSLECAAELGMARIELARDTGDRTLIGSVLHWAHRFVSSQGPDGDWPAEVNARTGEPVCRNRTSEPAQMLAMLGDFLDSSEFDRAVARSKHV